MSSELVMMEAALFQLRASLDGTPEQLPVRLSCEMLASALAAAKTDGLNPARMSDIDFALNDLAAAVEDAGASPPQMAAVQMLQQDAATLRARTTLSAEIIAEIRRFQTKLRARAKAIERSQFRAEGTDPAPLPHPPAELREEAIPLARQLAAEGFATPLLATLIAEPEELRYHSLNELADELEVIAGGAAPEA
jgi:hypothetical protein